MYFFVQQAENHEIDGFERPQSTPTPGAMSETMCVVFLFPQEKKHFLWKNDFFAFCTTLRLCQSRARSWKSQISWKVMIFIDFHWFWSKIMKTDGFRCSWTSPASGIRSEIACVAFLNRWEKIFKKSYANCFWPNTGCGGRPGASKTINFHDFWPKSMKINENHGFSWKLMIFMIGLDSGRAVE